MEEDLVFDKVGLMKRVSDDVELFRELLGLFFADYDRVVESLTEAQKARDGQRLNREAHAIKSALGNLGANRAYRMAFAIEKLGVQGDFAGSEASLTSLQEEVRAFKEAVSEFL